MAAFSNRRLYFARCITACSTDWRLSAPINPGQPVQSADPSQHGNIPGRGYYH
jgi:hypothetical protein